MKRGKLSVIGFGALLLLVTSMFSFTHALGTENEGINRGSELSQEEKQDINTLVYFIRDRLHQEGYGFVLDHAITPEHKVEIIVQLPTKEVKETTKRQIQQIVMNVIEQNDFKPDMFVLKVTSYYKPSKDGNRLSVRQSYNDLVGRIGQIMVENGYQIGIEHKVISNKNVEMKVIVDMNNLDNKTKKVVHQLVVDIIEKNNFDPSIFQITVTTFIASAEQMPQEKQKELEDFLESFHKKGGFLSQLGEDLKKEGYYWSIAGEVYSKDDIRLHIISPDIYEVTDQEQSKVNQIIKENVIKHKLDPSAFKIKIGNRDSSSL